MFTEIFYKDYLKRLFTHVYKCLQMFTVIPTDLEVPPAAYTGHRTDDNDGEDDVEDDP